MDDKNITIPSHIAFIMDGNGRWAKKLNKPRSYGHKKAVKNVEEVVKYCFSLGMKAVSLYAFSTENWNRPKEEVNELFELLRKFFKSSVKSFLSDNYRVRVMGNLDELPNDVAKDIRESILQTKDNTGQILNVGLNYGARSEIVRAVNQIIESGEKNITESEFSKYLYTDGMPDPDLIVRTSGEIRLSNFMLYQGAYAELYFTETLWPDFHKEDVDKAILEYSKRVRRFGKI